jgi:transcriptional regulator with XRE-family HTH domain
MNSIRDQIVALVKEAGISRTLIASKADVSLSTIEKIMAGEGRGVNSETAELIAGVFGKKFVLVDVVPEICEELVWQQGIYGFADSTTGEQDDK